MRTPTIVAAMVVALAGCATAGTHTLGGVPATARPDVEGTVVEKCPVASCWFRVRAGKRIVRVDLKPAGLTANEIPVGATVSVYGKRDAKTGDVIASGLRW